MAKKINNKSSKPNNIVMRDSNIMDECMLLESQLPPFMKEYFIYLRGAVAVTTRRAYLNDIKFFCTYIIDSDLYTNAEKLSEISLEDFAEISARDINIFLGDYCNRYYKEVNSDRVLYENNNKSLARKKSSLSTLFKFLYRNGQLKDDITGGFNPIKLPKPQPDAIKRLEILFITYGLRLNELRELNISSFNFSRGEFMIYRKRGKEVLMPINEACERVVKDYIDYERPKSSDIGEEDQDALFLSLQKKRMTSRSIRDLVKKYTSIAMKTSRDKGYSPHKLRATAATSLIETGFSIYDVQNLMDHDNVTTTQLYAAHRKNLKRDIVENFNWLDEDTPLGKKRND